MLRAYFDKSQTEIQSGVCVVGGYVETEAFWTTFEDAWRDRLDYWEIDDFHLTDLLAGQTVHGRTKGAECALSFANVIREHSPYPIWAGVVNAEWDLLDASAAFRERYPSPYQFLFQDILWQLARWGRIHALGEEIAPIFDMDAAPQSLEPIRAALRSSPHYGNVVNGIAFWNRRRCLPLQAADIVAGEMQRHWFDREYPMPDAPWYPEFRQTLTHATSTGSTGGLWTPITLERAVDALDRTGDPFNWA